MNQILEIAAEKYANDWEKIHPKLNTERITPIEVSKIDFVEGAKSDAAKEYWYARWHKEQDEVKCVAGCKHFTGGELKHHKDCFHYPESLSKMYDDLKEQERMYSEEEVLEILFELSCNSDTDKEEVEEWFEQFKKS
jgi:hypothetical protein